MGVGTFDPQNCLILFGPVPLKAFSEDSMVEIEQMGDGTGSVSGADGEVARALSSNRQFKITLSFLQTSPSNDILSAAWQADQALGGGVPVPFTVKDLSGRTSFFAMECWVPKLTTMSLGAKLKDREWELHTGKGTLFVGGNGAIV